MVCDKQTAKVRKATTSTCMIERPTLEVGKSTGTVQRPHWWSLGSRDTMIIVALWSEHYNLDGAQRGYYSSKLPKTTVSLWLGRLVHFPLGGFLDERRKSRHFLKKALFLSRQQKCPDTFYALRTQALKSLRCFLLFSDRKRALVDIITVVWRRAFQR